ncbi:NAD(P)/FAD-dependent oxidoreductase [Hydrogenimonas sp. SS33]|uniref:dihydrolipoyl dehydrogenase family protein n=1 Tax=Hydrogenimonas leucolamina TaxID=2954236 RepID=UPI00336BD224
MNYDYDIVFLGGGLNYAGAVVASKAGLKCALVEKNPGHLGGTCLHNGCIPSKMYLEAAREIAGADKPWIEGKLHLNMAKLDDAKETLLKRATEAITKQCARVDIVAGEGRVSAPHTVEVEGKKLTGRHIVIGTGSHPFIPEGIDYDGEGVITSDEVLNMRALPEKIAVYGDGAIGLEMASFFAAAGVPTELIWRHDTLLRRAHPMISANALKQMESLGVTLRPNSEIATAKNTKRGVHITFKEGSEHYVPTLLVATGRHAVTDIVQTPEIAVGRKGIETDIHFETSLADHYAIGDCNGKLQLAHAARAEVLYVVKRILGKAPEPIRLERIVKFIHTLPCSYALVGNVRTDFEKAEERYSESVVPLAGLPFAETHDAHLGVMVVYADAEGFIAGGEIFAPNAEELIATVAMALGGELDIATAKRTILAHPTFSESLEKAFLRL